MNVEPLQGCLEVNQARKEHHVVFLDIPLCAGFSTKCTIDKCVAAVRVVIQNVYDQFAWCHLILELATYHMNGYAELLVL